MKTSFTGQDITFITPTKDRPGKIKNLLNSLADQTEQCGRIIIVDGGESIKDLVLSFQERLPIEYYECRPPGQIRQRNMGISLLDDTKPLVCFMDDDIVLESNALENMIAFWNSREPDTAGIAFNIINAPRYTSSFIRRLLGSDPGGAGRVMKSGLNSSIGNVTADTRTQWLPGGATVWKLEIIRQFAHREIFAKNAVCEDLIFSYPIGKKLPLYVCHAGKVRHEHIYDHNVPMKHKYYGRTDTLWRLYFVCSNREDLSVTAFFAMLVRNIFSCLFHGIFFGRRERLERAFGLIEGFFVGLSFVLRGKDLIEAIEEKHSP